MTPELLLLSAALSADPDAQEMRGMEVIPAVQKVVEMVTPKDPPVPGKPWSNDLADLTDANPATHGPAIGRLVRAGSKVLVDLGIIAQDRNPEVRIRVARVAAGIGGELGAPLCIQLTKDADARVRRMATVGLGRCRGEPVYARAIEMLASTDPDEREAAAGTLSALADVRAIALLAARYPNESDGVVKPALSRALADLCLLPSAPDTLSGLLAGAGAIERRAILEVIPAASDTRLCPTLTHLVDDREAFTCLLAVRALASSGDARAVPALVRLATSERLDKLRDAAADTLRVLTGYRAGPGQAWVLWWRDHQAEYQRLAERDTVIAGLMDPAVAADPAALARFAPTDLMPLVDAAIETGRAVPTWFPARAMAALRADDHSRWIDVLERRIENETDGAARLGLVVLIDELGASRDTLDRMLKRLDTEVEESRKRWKDGGSAPADRSGERLALQLALSRRH